MPSTTTKTDQTFKVLLVEDHPMFREHLAHLIERDLGLEICGEADNILDAMQLILRSKPDIVVLDISLRGSSGLELLKDLKAHGIEVKVLVLSMHDEELYAERALRAGARGYLTKNEASAGVIDAIRQIMAGAVYASKSVTARLLERLTKKRGVPEVGGVASLADRELEVFELLGRGRNTKEIAAALNLGASTVETYRARIKAKLQLRSLADLYLRAGQWVRERT